MKDTVIRQQLADLENYYLHNYKEQPIESFGLMSGFSGIILLQSMFLELTRNEKFKKEVERNIKVLIKNIEKGAIGSTTFCTGLAGIGWLFEYLNQRKIVNTDMDAFAEDLDIILEKEADRMIKESDYDIMHGYLGLGMYFLKRKKNRIIEKMIRTLKSSSENIREEIAWKRLDGHMFHKYIYDFGLAHGNASILYFLTKCLNFGILPDVCRSMQKGSINFFIENIQNVDSTVSFFPSVKSADTYKVITEASSSRLAWCYGDLGILHSLLLSSDSDLIKTIIPLLEQSTHRKEVQKTLIEDPFFCHGSAGVAYLYLNIYKITKKEIFLGAAEYWTSETIRLLSAEENNQKVKTNKGMRDNLLTGKGGLALLFLSCHYKNFDNRVNEMFFLT